MQPRSAISNQTQAHQDVTHSKHVPGESQHNRDLGIAVHPASALDCAQSRESSATGKPVKEILRFWADYEQNCSPCHWKRHEKPVRTQCLTSAALCLCPHPNSVSLLSPIPKLASAARSPPVNFRPTRSKRFGQLVDTKALNCSTLTVARVLGSVPATNACVPLRLSSKTRQPAPLHSLRKPG